MFQAFMTEEAMAPTPALLPGKSHGQRSLVGCGPWGLEESDTTERLSSRLSCWGLISKQTRNSVLMETAPARAQTGCSDINTPKISTRER